MEDNFITKLNNRLQEMQIDLDEEKLKNLEVYYHMLIEKNKVMNLTAITEEDEVITKHFVDSLSLVSKTAVGEDFKNGKHIKCIDVGTGAGLPGLVLKIAYPNIEMVLFDSLNKRLKFLEEVIEELGLTGVTTKHGRAEDVAHDVKFRERFDFVFARAVANLSTLSEYCLPFAREKGYFVAYKSKEAAEEVKTAAKAIDILGGKVKAVNSFNIDSENERTIVTIEKIKKTPARFPRKAGTPSKEPIS
ncbi:MAG: 16S rRNA (guanine(527)-N(7))-methyltransferase RsmG [Eubacteriales bacterium]|nr:16S rRNA (guanine(527)-N(7))-methyltransferase RsmG [Eubacteriales bacterium]